MSENKKGKKSENGWRKVGVNEISQYDAAKLIIDLVRQYKEAGYPADIASDGERIGIILSGCALDDGGKLFISTSGNPEAEAVAT